MVIPTGLTDTEVITRVLQGEQGLFAPIGGITLSELCIHAGLYVLPTTARTLEEMAQDIFVKAYRSSPISGAHRNSAPGYIPSCTIPASVFSGKKDPSGADRSEKNTKLQVENRESGFKADIVEQKSKHAMLNQAIRLLSADDHQVISLFYKGEQSLEEIGRIMGLEPNTVKVKLHRARQRLKEKNGNSFQRRAEGISGGLNHHLKADRMNRQQQMEERLWDHIDGLRTTEERSLVEDTIAGNRE